jgi:hypothetical protein
MRRRLSLFLVFWMMLAGSPAWPQILRIIPIPPGVKPLWQKVPEFPRVSHAPNIPTDVFRYRGTYYLFWEGLWFESNKTRGPWKRARTTPKTLKRLDPSYFKTARRRGPRPPGPGRASPRGQPPPGQGLAQPIPPADVTPRLGGQPSAPAPGAPSQKEAPTPSKVVPKAM